MNAVEKMGLLKIDFLGLITLDMLEATAAAVKERLGVTVDLDHLPLDDEPTFELFRSGKTACVFQFDSGGMRDLLRRAKPRVFPDLAALNALYRPGALDAGTVEDYVRRRTGTSKVTYPLPELESTLSETLGILVYQEQVMRIAQFVAGYTLAEADLLRKAIGKKKREIMQAEAEKFIRKSVEHGTPKKKAQELWSLIEPFARYGFNKSHAVAYALVAYKTAYLKAHFPVDFFAANLSAEIGSTDGIVKVLGDCQESGIPVLPPDINESWESFAAVGTSIRFGLAAIKGVGEAAARSIARRAAEASFLVLHRLHRTARLPPREQAHARRADRGGRLRLAREETARPSPALRSGPSPGRRGPATRPSVGQSNLFGGGVEAAEGPARRRLPGSAGMAPGPAAQGREGHARLLRHRPSADPVLRGDRAASPTAASPTSRGASSSPSRVAGVLGNLKKQKIKKGVNEGKTMLKATLEDTSGTVPVAVFASLYEKVQSWVRDDLPVLAQATVRESGGAIELTIQEITPLEGIRERRARELAIRVNLAYADESVLARLQERLRRHPGTTPVSIRLVRPGEFEATLKAADSMRIAPSPRLTSEIQALAGEGSVEYVF